MDPRASAFWVRFKANRLAYTLTILVTLTVGILIGTVVSYGVKGKEGQNKAADVAAFNARLEAWFAHYLKGAGAPPTSSVEARTTTCPSS